MRVPLNACFRERRERQREHCKPNYLITEYSDSTWKCNQLGAFPSSLETDREFVCGFQGKVDYKV